MTPDHRPARKVPSGRGAGRYYLADHGTHWTCTCPDYVYRGMHAGNPGHICKHIAQQMREAEAESAAVAPEAHAGGG